MHERNPLVSICIPILNGEAFVEQAVISAHNQSYKNIEIICVDNQSTDRSYDIIKGLAEKLDNIKVFRNESTVSMYENFNRSIDYASGEFIKCLCADDLLHENCVEAYVEVFEKNEDVGLVTCRDHRIDEAGDTVSSTHPLNRTGKVKGNKIVKKMIREMTGTYTKTPTHVMYRKGDDPGFPLINENGWGNDTYKWMEILAGSNYYFVNRDLVSNRVHGDSFSASEAKVDDRMILQSYYNFFVQFIQDHRGVVNVVDIFCFKRALKRQLSRHGLSGADIDDWGDIL